MATTPISSVQDTLVDRGKRRQKMAACYLYLILFVLIVAIAGQTLVPDIISWERDRLRSQTARDVIEANLKSLEKINNELSSVEEELDDSTVQLRTLLDVRIMSNHGIAVGRRGIVLTTTDNGITWTRRKTPTTEDLQSVTLAEKGTAAIAVGRRGTVLTTTDNGITWTRRKTPTNKHLYGVALAENSTNGVAVGFEGTVLTTADGGTTWISRNSGTTEYLGRVALASDGITGIAVGGRGTIIITRDRGNTWSHSPSGTNENLYGVALTDSGASGVAVGRRGTIVITRDRGNTWSHPPSGTNENLYGVALTDSGASGVAVGRRGTVIITRDRGNTWSASPSETNENLYGVALASAPGIGIAVGADRTALVTMDHGTRWTNLTTGFRRTRDRLRARREALLSERDQLTNENRRLELGLPPPTSETGTVSPAPDQGSDTASKKDGDAAAQQQRWDDLITTTTWRLSILALALFFIQVLVALNRYNQRLAAYYFARSDALSLLLSETLTNANSEPIESLERIISMLSPDNLDFGRTPKTVFQNAVDIARSMYNKSSST